MHMMKTTTNLNTMGKYLKKCIAAMLALFGMYNGMIAQPEPDEEMDPKRKEKIEVLKRSFITDKIQLTVTEAEKFWPLYNERETSKEVIRKAIKDEMAEAKKNSKDEKTVLSSIDFITLKRKEEADADAKFLKGAMPIIGPDRCVKLASADREFQRELVKKMKEGRGDGPPNGKKRPHPKQ